MTPVRTLGEKVDEVDFLELPEKHRLVEVDCRPARGHDDGRGGPARALRRLVLAVKRMGRDGVERRFVPGPPDRFEHGDVVVVLGSDESLARLHDDRALPVPSPS